jgi:predicted transcriptional regulator
VSEEGDRLRVLVARIASAYVSNAQLRPDEMAQVIVDIAQSLRSAQAGGEAPAEPDAATASRASPAQIRKSITPDALISFEDSRRYKTLRRHLAARGLTPEAYRAKWGLPGDYPMVAPSYSSRRSELAKALGLGQKPVSGRR